MLLKTWAVLWTLVVSFINTILLSSSFSLTYHEYTGFKELQRCWVVITRFVCFLSQEHTLRSYASVCPSVAFRECFRGVFQLHQKSCDIRDRRRDHTNQSFFEKSKLCLHYRLSKCHVNTKLRVASGEITSTKCSCQVLSGTFNKTVKNKIVHDLMLQSKLFVTLIKTIAHFMNNHTEVQRAPNLSYN